MGVLMRVRVAAGLGRRAATRVSVLAKGSQRPLSAGIDKTASYARLALVLEDGSVFEGKSFGAPLGSAGAEFVVGEAVFQTGMVGYAEALTDPSYRGQMLSMTYPMVGNYGVPAFVRDAKVPQVPRITFESEQIHASALVVQDYSATYSHWDAAQSLGEWLAKENVPGICGVDTRRLAKTLRERGSMRAKLAPVGPNGELPTFDASEPALAAFARRHFVDEVTIAQTTVFPPVAGSDPAQLVKILAVDCGMKANMVRELCGRGAEVTAVRWDEKFDGMLSDYDGLFVSNGPGDPTQCVSTIAELGKVLSREGHDLRPFFGICLGNQLAGLASGHHTIKLPFGNRGQNQPVIDRRTGNCIVTSQNHGYAVDDSRLAEGWSALYTNANDGSNEGLIHQTKPFFTAQFHPEANGGPNDAAFLFDVFLDSAKRHRAARGANAPLPEALQFPAAQFAAVAPEARPKKVLLLGSGGLSIGQAGEFDYSGAQAIKALKEEGVEVVLMNPNIASVQTNVDASLTKEQRRADPGAADHVFFVPVTPDFVTEVIARERPDAILISMGGQTALNCGIELDRLGVFEKYGVKVLGTPIDVVIATEDREIFKRKCEEIGEPCATSVAVDSVQDALDAARDVTGYPCMCRAAFALGGLGSGIVKDEAELRALATRGLAVSPQLLIEKSMLGWKEVEYEVVRDVNDNCVTVCNMENFDPLGVHTGDSIVIAPSQTLSNSEYHMLRDAALRVVRHLGIIGECNIQYALHAESEEYAIIEVNPRLSRSSALASKATGYPLAFVAAKLSMGIPLPELRNKVTGGATTACFEPALDYCVTKFPRWDLGKFQGASRVLGSAMASVGEVMAIGRTFEESFQKAVRMVDPSHPGFEPVGAPLSDEELEYKLHTPTDRRVWAIADALYRGKRGDPKWNVTAVNERTAIDHWWLDRLDKMAALAVDDEKWSSASAFTKDTLLEAKQLGFSDPQIAQLCSAAQGCKVTDADVRSARKAVGVVPHVKQIDTLAAEYAAETNYLYTTYHADESDEISASDGSAARGGVLVLGSGPYRIGSSVEFDWCAVSAMRALRLAGKRGVMVNCNPETVSTDYDECDALYFEELSLERVMDIYEREEIDVGVVVSMGGQIPQNLAVPLHSAGANVLGTCPTMIDAAEDRTKFSALMDTAGVHQAEWAELTSHAEAIQFAERVTYPVMVRPSFVLSGAGMYVCRDEATLVDKLGDAAAISREFPVVISKFVRGARELEVDAVARDGVVVCAAVHEHVEDAGVHSGDATLMLPPHTVSNYALNVAREATAKIAKALNISGPMNCQFLIGGRAGPSEKDELDGSFASMNSVLVIECNLRASRSVPFVSKATGVDFADVATRVLAGLPLPDKLPPLFPDPEQRKSNFVAVKAPMFSFARLRGADPALGVEMSSTGEVACFGADGNEAFLKAMLSTTAKIPTKKGDKVLLSFAAPLAHKALASAYLMHEQGYELMATQKTHEYLEQRGVPSTLVAFPTDEDADGDGAFANGALNAGQLLKDRDIKLVVNLHSPESTKLADNFLIRRTAADFAVPLVTNAQLFDLLAESLARYKKGEILALQPHSLFEHYKNEQDADAWTNKDEFH